MAGEASDSWESSDNQKEKLMKLIRKKRKVDDLWYVVDGGWFQRWQKYVGFSKRKGLKGDESAFPGPLNNKPLFETCSALKSLSELLKVCLLAGLRWDDLRFAVRWKGLTLFSDDIFHCFRVAGSSKLRPWPLENLHYIVVPEDAWNSLLQWYSLAEGQVLVVTCRNHRFAHIWQTQELIHSIDESTDLRAIEVSVTSAADENNVLIPVYQREIRSEQNRDQGFFGQPLLVSFSRKKCTFKDIYYTLLECMGRYVRLAANHTMSIMEDDDSNDLLQNTESDGSSVDSRLDVPSVVLRNKPTCVEAGVMETDNSPLENKSIFSLCLCDYFDKEDIKEIIDNGKPVKFTGGSYITAVWSAEVKAYCYDEAEAEAVDESFNQRKVIQLTECLELFTTMEKLGEQNMWTCSDCRKRQQATKKFDIWSLPNILVVHLKRFSYDDKTRLKLDTFIEYPVRNLDLSSFVQSPKQGPVLYDLIATSNHYGDTAGGHYTTFAKNSHDNQWYCFNDDHVSPYNGSVITKAGYVLVYQQQTI